MILRTSALLFALGVPGFFLAAQTAPSQGAVPASGPAPATITLPSATLQPSLDVLKTALGDVRVDKWKAPSQVRSVVESNLQSIRNDVATTLPSLLAAADAAPGSTAKTLPAYRNVDALYDVLLRVVSTAQLAAPADQLSALDQALTNLEDRRRAFGDQLQQAADAQELWVKSQQRQVSQLQAALKAVPPLPPPPAPVKCPATPVRKKRPAAKRPAPTANSQNQPAPSH